MTAVAQHAPTPVPHARPDVDPTSTADALLRVAQLGAVPVLYGPPADLGPCLACPPLQVGGADPAVVVLRHRESSSETSWIHAWPLCGSHLVREAGPVLAKRTAVWVEAPVAVVEA